MKKGKREYVKAIRKTEDILGALTFFLWLGSTIFLLSVYDGESNLLPLMFVIPTGLGSMILFLVLYAIVKIVLWIKFIGRIEKAKSLTTKGKWNQ